MMFIVDNLHAGRIRWRTRQGHSKLHYLPQKRVQRDLKGSKLKVEFDYQVRSMAALMGFFLPWWGEGEGVLKIINHPLQQKAFF